VAPALVIAVVTTGLLLPAAGSGASAQEAVPAPEPPPAAAPVTTPPDVAAPTFTVTPTEAVEVDGALLVTFSEPVTGVDSGTLRLRGTASTILAGSDGTSFTLRAARPLYAGAAYVVESSPRIADAAGNAHLPQAVRVTASALVDDRSPGLRLLGTWSRLSASGAAGGSYVRSVPIRTRWTATHTDVFGGGVQIRGCLGPGNGILEVWADGRRLASVDTYREATGCGVRLASVRFPTGTGLHLVEVRGLGEKRRASSGTAIAVDAVTALP
jgi:hypothetical protein